MHEPRRYIVLGAGAIGASTAALLTEAGAAVVLVARSGREVLEGGVQLRTPSGGRTVVVPVVGSLAEAAPTPEDLVGLAVMGHDTAAAVAALARDVPVLSFQNGTFPLDFLAARGNPTLAGMIYLPAERRAPGVIALAGVPVPGVVLVGAWSANDVVKGWIPAVVRRLCEARYRAEAVPEIAPWVRAKLLVNLGGIVVALCDAPPAAIIEAAQAEALAVFAASGEPVVPLVEFFARIGTFSAAEVDGVPRVGGSTRFALARGEPLETASLHGGIVAVGLRFGVPTPVNAGLIVAAERAVRERLAPGALDEATLRAWIGVDPRLSSGLREEPAADVGPAERA